LITEAVRGEGAILLDAAGERFTDELAPRDAVAAAILARMHANGAEHVRLDLRGIDPKRFPSIFATLSEAGLDARTEPIPVAPAAHYMMGGVATDLDGHSSLPGLLAVGECACTGLHGANRLASNSLTECFVFGSRAAESAAVELTLSPTDPAPPPSWRLRAASAGQSGRGLGARRSTAAGGGAEEVGSRPLSAREDDRCLRTGAPRIAGRSSARRRAGPRSRA